MNNYKYMIVSCDDEAEYKYKAMVDTSHRWNGWLASPWLPLEEWERFVQDMLQTDLYLHEDNYIYSENADDYYPIEKKIINGVEYFGGAFGFCWWEL